MNEHAQTPTEIIASLEKRLAAMEAEKVNLVTENISLRQLYEQAPLPYQSLDSTGCFIEINQAWADALGYAKEEVLGRNFGDFLHPDWKDHFKENFPRFKAIGEILGIEFEMVKKDGSTTLVSFHGKIGKDPGGQFRQTHCIFQDVTERKNAENSLRLRESYLSAIINNHPGLLWLKDRQNKFLAVNAEFSKSCGLNDPELLVGKTDLDIWPKELADKYIADDAEVLKSGKPLVVEEAISDKGEMKWFETFKAPVFGSQEIAIGTTGYSREITERKRNEEALKESEERLQLVMEGSQLGYWDWNIVTGEVRRNKHWAGMLGYTLKEIEDSTHQWTDLHHPDDRAAAWQSINDHLEGKTPAHRIEYRMRAKNGQYRWILDQARIVKRNSEGKPIRMSGTHTDITERKQVEERIRESETRLRESEHHFRTLANSGLALIWTSGSDKLCNYFNEPWLRYTGRTLEQELGNGWAEGVHPEDFDRCLNIYVSHFDRREPFSMEYRLRKANGEYGWILDLGNPRHDSEGNFDGYIGYCYDITDRKLVEEEKKILNAQLQQAQKLEAIGCLAGGIAHDFNNILGAIVGYAEMIRDDLPPGSRSIHDIDQVITASHRAKDLVKQILAFSRQGEDLKIPIQPAVIVKEAITLLRSSLPTTITIKHDIDPDAGMVLADPTQIHQVVMNLCTNAFHAMEVKGGMLTITLQKKILSKSDLATEPDLQPGVYVQLSIRDTGEGIPLEIREKIFDPFFTTKEVGKGTGLGLSMVYSIVKSCKGSIACNSRLSEGTEFRIFLPELEGNAVQENRSANLATHGKGHILLIDDEEMLVELGQTMLQRLGYHVTTRRNSLDALATFQNQPDTFDLVITDQTMPGMTGVDLARRILQIRPHMPIILCTGFSSVVDEDMARAAGINGFAYKPLAKKDIGQLIRKVLDGNNL